ncbi:cytochrome b/b6 domain-containing protein [Methylobacter sp.]|uniref:cytochrome b/b6 domain-containing protein n=1 Tax=Methylobacter sp. TaxID=2051955 RepID=UPI002487A18D|nr:cytochrome b/b6 domain-containing protein [Methylobacter sp.]MDI1276084.1 cytochrome b/b6 domain-containing protein [Methylobacter sp.]MDI1356846.1 cytochrome b/b6 domain-containing protein [Methylobacter sp.]
MNSQELVKVWDLPLRIFHWLLVAGFFIAYLTEDDLLTVHVWAGYLVTGLLAFRLVWGFIGNDYARFSNFLCSPAKSIAYIKDLLVLKTRRYLGHNPAGAAMIVLLLVSLLATVITGFAVYGADQAAGPLAAIGPANEKMWEEVHEFFANFTLILVAVHVAGVAIESYIHRENLARAMVHGFKKK